MIGRQSPNSSAWYPSLTTWCYKTLAHLSNLALQIPTPCLPPLLPPPNPYIFFTHGSWPRCPLTFPLTQGAQLSSQGLMKPSRLNPPPPSSPYWHYVFAARLTPITGLGVSGSVYKTNSQGTVYLGPSSSGNRMKNLSSPLLSFTSLTYKRGYELKSILPKTLGGGVKEWERRVNCRRWKKQILQGYVASLNGVSHILEQDFIPRPYDGWMDVCKHDLKSVHVSAQRLTLITKWGAEGHYRPLYTNSMSHFSGGLLFRPPYPMR